MEGKWYCVRPTLLIQIYSLESGFIELPWMAESNSENLIDLSIETLIQNVA